MINEEDESEVKMQDLKLTVTLEEANLILAALAELPFAKVFALVAKLQDQAGQQLDRAAALGDPPVDKGAGTPEVEPLAESVEESSRAA
jgi:hypothetical protein